MNQSFKLYRLQQVDSNIDQTQPRLEEINALLSDNEMTRQAELTVQKAEVKLQETRKSLRQAENITIAHRRKIKETESRLYGGKVRDPKELQNMQNESEALNRFLLILEERQLEVMIAVDEAESKFQFVISKLDKIRGKVIETNAALVGEQTRLNNDVERYQLERKVAREAIPEDDLRLYENLRQRRGGVAVAKIIGRACGACGSTLNSSLHQAARSPHQISYCDTCRRVLYGG